MINDITRRVAARVARMLCKYRGRRAVDALASLCDTFHRGLNNVDFNMHRNGELRALKLISSLRPQCIFDVGANNGDWSRLAASMNPECMIHAFEIVPKTFAQLRANAADLKNVRANMFGLSDQDAEIVVNLSDDTSTATACRIEGMKAHDDYYREQISCRVAKASDYVREHRIERIDFVKIDVEGMDLKVIRGFGDTLNRVRALQFEYGVFNIASRDLLADFYRYLTFHGFVVGKVFPSSVLFSDFSFDMENFHGSNYLAVKSDESDLISALAQRR